MAFELWDVETNKYLGRFEDERDALVLVRTLVEQYGPEYADRLDLGATTGKDASLEPLSGAALCARTCEVLADNQPLSERRGELIATPRRGFAGSIEPMAAAGRGFMRRADNLRQHLRRGGAMSAPDRRRHGH